MQNRIPITRAVGASTALILAAGCGGGESSEPARDIPPQVGLPTEADVAVADSELRFDAESSVSPTGAARLGRLNSEWCLEDASGSQCLPALAEELGAVQWRDDEEGVAITAISQDPISIIDFAAGSVVETTLDEHRILDWSPDGDTLLGLEREAPDEIVQLDAETLDDSSQLTTLDEPTIPQLRWVRDDVVWGSDPQSADVFVLDSDGDRTALDGGLGAQEFLSISPDGRFALTEDDDVARGQGDDTDPILWMFDATEERSVGIAAPDELSGSYVSAQLAADGSTVLLLTNGRDGVGVLHAVTIDPESLEIGEWVEVAGWPDGQEFEPVEFHPDSALRWNGTDTAWVISGGGDLLEVTLSAG